MQARAFCLFTAFHFQRTQRFMRAYVLMHLASERESAYTAAQEQQHRATKKRERERERTAERRRGGCGSGGEKEERAKRLKRGAREREREAGEKRSKRLRLRLYGGSRGLITGGRGSPPINTTAGNTSARLGGSSLSLSPLLRRLFFRTLGPTDRLSRPLYCARRRSSCAASVSLALSFSEEEEEEVSRGVRARERESRRSARPAFVPRGCPGLYSFEFLPRERMGALSLSR